MVAGAQVVDVSPVGYNHAVPVEVLFEPTGEQFAIGVERHAVVHARVHHQRECASAHSFEERGEIFFAHVDVRHRRRGAVLAAHGHAVSHIVLSARCYVELVDVVRVVALETLHSLDSHLSIYVAVLAEALPHARPARVAAEVHHRRVGPRNAAGAGFVSRNLASAAHELAVERSRHVDALRKQRAVEGVGGAVNLVDAVDARNAYFFHRLVLNLAYHVGPNLLFLCHVERHVENRAYLVFANHRVEHSLAELQRSGALVVGEHVDGDFAHLTDFFVERHLLHDCVDFLFDCRIGCNGGFNLRLNGVLTNHK